MRNGFQWPSNWSIILMKGPAGCILLVWSHDLQAIDVWYIFELHALWTVDSVLYSYVRCYTNDLYHRNWSCPSIRRCYLLMLWTNWTDLVVHMHTPVGPYFQAIDTFLCLHCLSIVFLLLCSSAGDLEECKTSQYSSEIGDWTLTHWIIWIS